MNNCILLSILSTHFSFFDSVELPGVITSNGDSITGAFALSISSSALRFNDMKKLLLKKTPATIAI